MDIQTVQKVARLARLALSEEKQQALCPQLGKIMGFVEQLGEVDTDGVEPLANVAGHELRWREDKVTEGEQEEAILANAPEQAEGFFVVPKVVE